MAHLFSSEPSDHCLLLFGVLGRVYPCRLAEDDPSTGCPAHQGEAMALGAWQIWGFPWGFSRSWWMEKPHGLGKDKLRESLFWEQSNCSWEYPLAKCGWYIKNIPKVWDRPASQWCFSAVFMWTGCLPDPKFCCKPRISLLAQLVIFSTLSPSFTPRNTTLSTDLGTCLPSNCWASHHFVNFWQTSGALLAACTLGLEKCLVNKS